MRDARWLPLLLPLLLLPCCTTDPGPTTQPDAAAAPGNDKVSCEVDQPAGIAQRRQAIVGGTDLAPAELRPGQQAAAGAVVSSYLGKDYLRCSATLVSDRLALTAAHCVIGPKWDGQPETVVQHLIAPSSIRFFIGPDILKPEAKIDIKEIHVPDVVQAVAGDFRHTPSSLGYQHDLAALVLAQPASQLHAEVEPIPPNLAPLDPMLGEQALIGGFGLQDFASRTNTKQAWTSFSLEAVNPYYFNLASQQGVVAAGDSGGGFIMRFADGQARVIGVVTGPLFPGLGVFGPRVDAYGAWLQTLLPDPCEGISSLGTCNGATAIWCEDGKLVSVDCKEKGSTCGRDLCNRHRCIPEVGQPDPRCASLDYFGRCTPEGVAEWCVYGEYRRRDCAADGLVCGWSPDPKVGHTCLSAPAPDGGPDQDTPDQGTSTTTHDSCAQLSACAAACKGEMWCVLDCVVAAGKAAKSKWSKIGICEVCAAAPSYCSSPSASSGQCASDCGADWTSAACLACFATACKPEIDLCLAD